MQTRARLFALATLLASTAGPVRAQAVLGGEWRNDVDSFVQRVVDAGLAPGLGVAVAVGDRVVYSEGFGVVDIDSRRPVEEHTQFYIASTTKALTATAALIAAQRGELDLDAPMTRYLPDARLPAGVDPRSIRVRDLLGLTHGLAGNGPVVFRTAFTGEFTEAQLLELLRHHEATGSREFAYNNLGYNLVGLVLEAVYDESWKDVVQRLVLDPLGMTSTTAWRSRSDPARLAMPHEIGADGFRRIPLGKYDENLHAAGGHFTTAADLARFLAAHMSDGRIDGVERLPGDALAATHRQHAAQDRDFGPYHRHGWGLGWDLGTLGEDTIVHRFGGFSGFRSHASFMPAHDIAVVVLTNGDGPASPSTDLIANYIYERLLLRPGVEQRYSEQLATFTARAATMQQQVVEHLAERAARHAAMPRPLADYAGVYENPQFGTMDWRVIAGGLELRMGVVQTRAEVYDADADALRVEVAGSGNVATFRFSGRGQPAQSVQMADVVYTRVGGL